MTTVAVLVKVLVVDYTADRAKRDEQLGCIAERLACVGMAFQIAEFVDGTTTPMRVDFPDRPSP